MAAVSSTFSMLFAALRHLFVSLSASPPASRAPALRHAGIAACVLVTACAFVAGSATAGVAAPKPDRDKLKAELAAKNKEADKLIAEYNARRVALAEAQKAERAAKDKLTRAETAYSQAEQRVGHIAGLRYQGSDLSVPSLLFGDDMGTRALMEQMAAEQAAYLDGFATARDARKKATAEASALTDRIREQADEVDGQRKDAEKLIGDIEDRLDKMIIGTGRRPDGSWAPELPTGSDNITSRTRLMRDEVQDRFSRPFPVGCYRVDTSGEHPLGRACDFMLSSGGGMPSPAMAGLGDALAAWVIKNARRMGVKYVIYKQRIYNMSSPGWRGMSNRGSITQNHFDHVHVSMY